MKQTVIWLALALLFAIGVTLSFTADSFGPASTAETTGRATLVETPQPVVAASAKPAEPEVPVAMLDDVPPRPTIGSEALARWYVVPGASPAPRAAEAPVAPLPLAPVTTATIAGQAGQGSKAGIKPLRQRPASQKAPRQQRATARQAANGQRQSMRIVKPIFGSVATIESHIALPDQALGRVRPTAYRDIGLHQRQPSLRRWPAATKKLVTGVGTRTLRSSFA